MKRNLIWTVLLGLAVLGLAITASAFQTGRMWANIPFSFYVSDRALPAGEYVFELVSVGRGATGSAVVLRSRDGSTAQFLPIICAGSDAGPVAHQVVFTRHGDSYFLKKLHQGNYKADFPRTRAEKERSLALMNGAPAGTTQAVVVAAMPE